MVSDILRESVGGALKKLGLTAESINFEHPSDPSHGDYSTNIAMVLAKPRRPNRKDGVGVPTKTSGKEKKNPKELAGQIITHLDVKRPSEVERVEVAGAGFINFYLTKKFLAQSLKEATNESFGKNKTLAGKKIILEYTDPNPFKVFHIGHLMPNVIGESLARLADYTGADVKRVNYQSDIGLHIAEAIWALKKDGLNPHDIHDQGKAYALGKKQYEENKEEIDNINKKLFEKSDNELNEIYEKGRDASLEYFEKIYQKLGTKFDHYFFESETWQSGREIVEKHSDLFQKSDGAIVFKGEDYGLHTRVFVNSIGLPTYEAKDLGLAKLKSEKFPYDFSIIITGNEQNAYFDVVIEAMKHVYEDEKFGEKTTHIGHGLLMLPTGKMSSRTGDVIPAETLLSEVEDRILEVMEEREIPNRKETAEMIAVSAIKYTILKQGIGRDVHFDFDKSISFEGDSGPYLQYTYVRAKSVLAIAEQKGLNSHLDVKRPSGEVLGLEELERLIYRFPEVVERAWEEKGPQLVVKFLIDLAGAFNSFYAQEKIAEEGGEYKVLMTRAVANVLKNGLYLLGIKAPNKM